MSNILERMFRFNKNFEKPDVNNTYIPDSFAEPVLRHIILNNILEKASNFSPPLLLGIQGGYGMGKTFMVKELCKQYSIEAIQLSSSDFSGSVEAASRDRFRKTYEDACIQRAKSNRYIVILIDDFHLSIATEDDVGKTVNSNLLTSAIMNICDNPWVSNYRIPIILTGNNFSRVYGAVIRVGRMDLLSWMPNEEEKLEIVSRIFSARFEGINSLEIKKLLETYPDNSIAFFAQVAEDILLCSFGSVLNRFRNSNGIISISELRQKLRESVEEISSNSSIISSVAAERNKKIIQNFETTSSNPNQIKKEG